MDFLGRDEAGRIAARIVATENANASTPVHELHHVFRRTLRERSPELADMANRIWGQDGDKWTVDAEESFARTAELWHMDGSFPTTRLEQALGHYADAMREVYGSAEALHAEGARELTPEVRSLFGQMLSDPGDRAKVRLMEEGLTIKDAAQAPVYAAMRAVKAGARNFGEFVHNLRSLVGKGFEAFRAKLGGTKGLMDLFQKVRDGMEPTETQEALATAATMRVAPMGDHAALDFTGSRAPFRMGDSTMEVRNGKPMVDGREATEDQFRSIYRLGSSSEADAVGVEDGAQTLYQIGRAMKLEPGVRPFEDEKAVGKNFGTVEKLMSLPSRIGQSDAVGFDYVRTAILRHARAVESFNTQHAGVRDGFRSLGKDEAKRLFTEMAKARMIDNGDGTRGKVYTDQELAAKGFGTDAIQVYRDSLKDYRDQITEIRGLLEGRYQQFALKNMTEAEAVRRELDMMGQALGDPEKTKEREALDQRLQRLSTDLAMARLPVERYDQIMASEKAYVPLVRDGNFAVWWNNEDGSLAAMVMGKDEKDARRKALALETSNPDLRELSRSSVHDKRKFNQELPKTMPAEMADLVSAATALGVDAKTAFELASTYDDLTAERNNLGGFKKHLIRAQGLEGYETDPIQAHARYTDSAAKFVAGLKHGQTIQRRIAELEKPTTEGTPVNRETVAYLRKLHHDAINNPVMPWVTQLQQGTSYLQLANHYGFILQQLVQKTSHDLPTLQGIYGLGTATKFWGKAQWIATKMAARVEARISEADLKGLVADPKKMADDINSALEASEKEGVFLDNNKAELIRSMAGTDTTGKRVFEKAMDIGFKPISASETHNRRATFIAQYLLAREVGYPAEKGFDPNQEPDKLGRAVGADLVKLDHNAAMVLADKQVDWVHNLRGPANRSEFQRAAGGLGMLPTQYRYFMIEYIQQLHQIQRQGAERLMAKGVGKAAAYARASAPLATSIGSMVAAAGTAGLPLLLMVLRGLRTLWNDTLAPAHPIPNIEAAMDRAAPRWLTHGLPTLAGVNMENAIGVGDPAMIKRKDSAFTTGAKMLLGASGSAFDTYDSAKKAIAGDAGDKAAFAASVLLGRGGGNLARAIGGESVMPDGGRVPLTTGERIAQGLGVPPDRPARIRGFVNEAEDARLNARSASKALADPYAEALRDGDRAKAAELMKEIQAYNRRMTADGRKDETISMQSVGGRLGAKAKATAAAIKRERQQGFRQ